jgi:Lar family restriction alleviation protein
MNCKPGDLAVVRSTCPLEHIRGHVLRTVRWIGELDGFPDIWEFDWCGDKQPSDDGKFWVLRNNVWKGAEMSHKLLPCPFCGGAAKLHTTAFGRPVMKWVQCTACEAGATAFTAVEHAYLAWNNRVSDRQLRLELNAEVATNG